MKPIRPKPKSSSSSTRLKGLFGKWKRSLKIAALLFFILFLTWGVTNDFWRVKKVVCQENGYPCSPALWADLMNLASGKNLLFLSPQKLASQFKEKQSEVFAIEAKKKLPSTLVFRVEIRKPVAVIKAAEDYFLVDKEGFLLQKVDQISGLPQVVAGSLLVKEIGQRLQEEVILKEILALYGAQLRLLEPKLAREVSERAFEVEFKNGPKVLFSTQKELGPQLDSLQFILDQTKIEGGRPKQIDLRFDKPILMMSD